MSDIKQKVSNEVRAQMQTLLRRGYPQAIEVSENEFQSWGACLEEILCDMFVGYFNDATPYHAPVLLVVPRTTLSIRSQAKLAGYEYAFRGDDFNEDSIIDFVDPLYVPLFAIVNIRRGGSYCGIDPKIAAKKIMQTSAFQDPAKHEYRRPGILEDGLALLTHMPFFLDGRRLDFPGSMLISGARPYMRLSNNRLQAIFANPVRHDLADTLVVEQCIVF